MTSFRLCPCTVDEDAIETTSARKGWGFLGSPSDTLARANTVYLAEAVMYYYL